MQDVLIGDPYFDDNFIIKGNDENRIRLLLNVPGLKQLIQAQPDISFQIRDDEGWFGTHFPEGVDQLYFQCYGVVKDEKRLKSLFDLFSMTLETLVPMVATIRTEQQVIF